MIGLRNMVYNAFTTDPTMNGLGFDASNVYPVYSRDSTPESVEGQQFIILLWGVTGVGFGDTHPVDLDVAVYNRSADYEPIIRGLKRGRVMLEEMIGKPVDPQHSGWFTGWNFQGSGPDLFDDVYQAFFRSESHRIVASGN